MNCRADPLPLAPDLLICETIVSPPPSRSLSPPKVAQPRARLFLWHAPRSGVFQTPKFSLVRHGMFRIVRSRVLPHRNAPHLPSPSLVPCRCSHTALHGAQYPQRLHPHMCGSPMLTACAGLSVWVVTMLQASVVDQIEAVKAKFTNMLASVDGYKPQLPGPASASMYDTLSYINEVALWTRRAVVAASVRKNTTPEATQAYFEAHKANPVLSTVGATPCASAWHHSVSCMEDSHGVDDGDDDGECAELVVENMMCFGDHQEEIKPRVAALLEQ